MRLTFYKVWNCSHDSYVITYLTLLGPPWMNCSPCSLLILRTAFPQWDREQLELLPTWWKHMVSVLSLTAKQRSDTPWGQYQLDMVAYRGHPEIPWWNHFWFAYGKAFKNYTSLIPRPHPCYLPPVFTGIHRSRIVVENEVGLGSSSSEWHQVDMRRMWLGEEPNWQRQWIIISSALPRFWDSDTSVVETVYLDH